MASLSTASSTHVADTIEDEIRNAASAAANAAAQDIIAAAATAGTPEEIIAAVKKAGERAVQAARVAAASLMSRRKLQQEQQAAASTAALAAAAFINVKEERELECAPVLQPAHQQATLGALKRNSTEEVLVLEDEEHDNKRTRIDGPGCL